MPAITDAGKSKFSLLVEETLTFGSSIHLFREVKSISLNFKQLARRCYTLLNVFI